MEGIMQPEQELVSYRIQRAEQTLGEAQLAIEQCMLQLAENRIYYSIFYAVMALSLRYNFSTSKHSTLRGWFNQMFLKTKTIDLEFGKTYASAYEKRQKADYDDFITFTVEEATSDLENARKFVDHVKRMIDLASEE